MLTFTHMRRTPYEPHNFLYYYIGGKMLHYKLQIGCLIILLYICYIYLKNKYQTKDKFKWKLFDTIILFSIIYLIFDILTVFHFITLFFLLKNYNDTFYFFVCIFSVIVCLAFQRIFFPVSDDRNFFDKGLVVGKISIRCGFSIVYNNSVNFFNCIRDLGNIEYFLYWCL